MANGKGSLYTYVSTIVMYMTFQIIMLCSLTLTFMFIIIVAYAGGMISCRWNNHMQVERSHRT